MSDDFVTIYPDFSAKNIANRIVESVKGYGERFISGYKKFYVQEFSKKLQEYFKECLVKELKERNISGTRRTVNGLRVKFYTKGSSSIMVRLDKDSPDNAYKRFYYLNSDNRILGNIDAITEWVKAKGFRYVRQIKVERYSKAELSMNETKKTMKGIPIDADEKSIKNTKYIKVEADPETIAWRMIRSYKGRTSRTSRISKEEASDSDFSKYGKFTSIKNIYPDTVYMAVMRQFASILASTRKDSINDFNAVKNRFMPSMRRARRHSDTYMNKRS